MSIGSRVFDPRGSGVPLTRLVALTIVYNYTVLQYRADCDVAMYVKYVCAAITLQVRAVMLATWQ